MRCERKTQYESMRQTTREGNIKRREQYQNILAPTTGLLCLSCDTKRVYSFFPLFALFPAFFSESLPSFFYFESQGDGRRQVNCWSHTKRETLRKVRVEDCFLRSSVSATAKGEHIIHMYNIILCSHICLLLLRQSKRDTETGETKRKISVSSLFFIHWYFVPSHLSLQSVPLVLLLLLLILCLVINVTPGSNSFDTSWVLDCHVWRNC